MGELVRCDHCGGSTTLGEVYPGRLAARSPQRLNIADHWEEPEVDENQDLSAQQTISIRVSHLLLCLLLLVVGCAGYFFVDRNRAKEVAPSSRGKAPVTATTTTRVASNTFKLPPKVTKPIAKPEPQVAPNYIIMAGGLAVYLITLDGSIRPLLKGHHRIALHDHTLYTLEITSQARNILTYDLRSGFRPLGSIPIPDSVRTVYHFQPIPDGRLALYYNPFDSPPTFAFIDGRGKLLATVPLQKRGRGANTGLETIVHKGDLVVCEGLQELYKVNLKNYSISSFFSKQTPRNSSEAGIARIGDQVYWTRGGAIVNQVDAVTGQPQLLCNLKLGSVRDLEAAGQRLFALVHDMEQGDQRAGGNWIRMSSRYKRASKDGVLMEINPQTGESKILMRNLNWPAKMVIVTTNLPPMKPAQPFPSDETKL